MSEKIAQLVAPYSEAKIAKWKIPAYKEMSPEKGVFRNISLKWSELPIQGMKGANDSMDYICCDILELDEMVNLSTATIIFARSIRLSKGAGITQVEYENPVACLIASQEIVDALTGEAVTLPVTYLHNGEEKQYDFEVAPKDKPLQVFEWEQGAPSFLQPYPISKLDPAFFNEGEPIQIYLRSLFQMATLLLDEDADLSIRQLQFVAALSQANKNTRSIGGEALALASTIQCIQNAKKNNALLVPHLDHRLYAESAKACLDLLLFRQAEWKKIQRNINDIEQWKSSVSNLLSIQQNEATLNEQLLQKAKDTRQQVLDARSIAGQQIMDAQVRLIYLQEAFKAGVENDKNDKILEGIKDIIFGVIKIAAALPNIVTGAPAVAETIAGGLNFITGFTPPIDIEIDFGDTTLDFMLGDMDLDEYAKAADIIRTEQVEKQIKATADANEILFNKFGAGLTSAKAGATEVFSAFSGILQAVNQAEKMKRDSEIALLQTSDAVSRVFVTDAVQGLDTISGGAQVWEKLTRSIKSFFEEVDKGIAGRSEYLEQLLDLIDIGRVYCESRLALADANGKLAEMIMRNESAKKAVGIYEKQIDKLDKEITNDATIAQLIFGRVLDAKRAVYLAMEAYRRAFEYHTLTEPVALPRLSDSIDDFVAKVTKISGRLLDVSSLKGKPTSMKEINVSVPISELSKDPKEEGKYSYTIKPDDSNFYIFYRIRFKEMQVFLDGLKTDKKVTVRIQSSPGFKDKTSNGDIKSFTSEPVDTAFGYIPVSSTIESSTEVASRYDNDFFLPTPFTTWTIKVTDNEGKVPNLSSVTKVRFVFIGSHTLLKNNNLN